MQINKTKFVPGKTKILYGGVDFGKKEKIAINKILDKNWWGIGEETIKFEKELAKYLGVKYAVFVNSGSSALLLAFAALNLPKNSEVIVPAVTFPTPISALIFLGIKPIVVDIDLNNFNIDPIQIEKAITSKTKAILAVHVAGNPCDMPKIMKIAKKHHLFVIEDNCDGFGGKIGNKFLGTYGDISCISTHAAHMITTGEGGVVFIKKKDLANKIKSFSEWGRLNHLSGKNGNEYKDLPADYARRYIYNQLGFNLKPLELQSAMGREQLKKIGVYKKLRAEHYNKLYKIFLQYPKYFFLPKTIKNADPCWYTFAFLIQNQKRLDFVNFLDRNKIEWRNILAGNIANQPAYKNLVNVPFKLTNADKVINYGLWISVHPLLSNAMLNYINESFKQYFN